MYMYIHLPFNTAKVTASRMARTTGTTMAVTVDGDTVSRYIYNMIRTNNC